MDAMYQTPHVKTIAFRVFEENLKQSFHLTNLVQEGGKLIIRQLKDQTNIISKRIVGLDINTYLALSNEQKHQFNISTQDVQDMLDIEKKITENNENIQQMTTVTLPNILLTYLFTAFEAYLQDILDLTFTKNPHLLTKITNERSAKNKETLNSIINTRDKVKYLIMTTDLKLLFKDIFKKHLDVPMDLLWKAMKTNPDTILKGRRIRNLYVHSGGIIDAEFKKAMGDSKLEIGKRYELTFRYLGDLARYLLQAAQGIDFYLAKRTYDHKI